MPKSYAAYAPVFRRQMVELVRSGRTPDELSREFEPTAHSIWNWVRQADRDDCHRQDGSTSRKCEERRDTATNWSGEPMDYRALSSRLRRSASFRDCGSTFV